MEDKTIYTDLLAAQREMPKLQKTEENPFFKSKYVPLDQVLDKVLPVLNKHNLTLLQTPGFTDDGKSTLITQLIHTSGETIQSTMLLHSKSADPQAQGSAITYARRYALTAMLGLAVGEDDDGNAATTAEAKHEEQQRMQTSPIAVRGFYETLKSRGVTEKEDAQRILGVIDPNWEHQNTSGIARIQKEIEKLVPDTIDEILADES